MWTFGRHQHLSARLLSGYLDQQLSAGERARVSRRLASCASCREELASWRATQALLQGLEDVPAPRSFTLAAPPRVPVAAPQPLPMRAPRWVYAGAASVAGLALAVMVSAEAAGMLPAAPTTPDVATRAFSPQAAAPAPEPASEPALAADAAEAPEAAPPEAMEPMRAAEAMDPAAPPPAAQPEPTPAPVAPFALEPAPDPPPAPADALPAEVAPDAAEDAIVTFAVPPSEEVPTAEPGPAPEPAVLAEDATPLFWRVLQGTAAALLVVFLGFMLLKGRRTRRTAGD